MRLQNECWTIIHHLIPSEADIILSWEEICSELCHSVIWIMHRLMKLKNTGKAPAWLNVQRRTCLQDGISSEPSKQTLNNLMSSAFSGTGLKGNLWRCVHGGLEGSFCGTPSTLSSQTCRWSQPLISSCLRLCGCRLKDVQDMVLLWQHIVHTRRAALDSKTPQKPE